MTNHILGLKDYKINKIIIRLQPLMGLAFRSLPDFKSKAPIQVPISIPYP